METSRIEIRLGCRCLTVLPHPPLPPIPMKKSGYMHKSRKSTLV